jgi:hypothetical protein
MKCIEPSSNIIPKRLQVGQVQRNSIGGIAALRNNSVMLESRHLSIWAAYYVDGRYHVLVLARRKDDIAARKAHSSSVHTTVSIHR